jgi:hypothetical protein
MSVMISLRMAIDPDRFEEVVGNDPPRLERISQRAREAGCISHAFYANAAGGELLVVDEWPDADSFMGFFEGSMDEIVPMMTEAGMTERPTPTVWRQLDTPDRF